MRLLAIDPGDTESAYVIIDATTHRPINAGKLPNHELMRRLHAGDLAFGSIRAVIEMVASYGMPVGAEVFDTCVWIGRFAQHLETRLDHPPTLVKRLAVKLHHCYDTRAKDSNIRQALVDRFAPGQPNHGKGTKADPGWFYGFHSDIWQAYALAVYAADHLEQP